MGIGITSRNPFVNQVNSVNVVKKMKLISGFGESQSLRKSGQFCQKHIYKTY
ncbi:hypothetical cytosolic protein [Syntrophus aciditrophicus SB]|uniref:Hypothetical cytosolic protein n=1 Tax=Syntrophus aciditrophicus (strain SB) TaxID=56780 RepID=Q2LQX6_SYNAS|nr:hypothetical cytosolic protein [Syntrophus aciditrophicus SB]